VHLTPHLVEAMVLLHKAGAVFTTSAGNEADKVPPVGQPVRNYIDTVPGVFANTRGYKGYPRAGDLLAELDLLEFQRAFMVVGAIDENGQSAAFSQFGEPDPDRIIPVYAPGKNVWVAGRSANSAYKQGQGTSYSKRAFIFLQPNVESRD